MAETGRTFETHVRFDDALPIVVSLEFVAKYSAYSNV
jgi:hypothetical protein